MILIDWAGSKRIRPKSPFLDRFDKINLTPFNFVMLIFFRYYLKYLYLGSDYIKAEFGEGARKTALWNLIFGVTLMETVINLLEAIPFWGWITLIVIGSVAIEGIVKVRRMQIKHVERMEKIKQGIDPGDETEAYKKDEV